MAPARLKKHSSLLRVLRDANPKLRKSIIENCPNDLIYCLCECIENVLNYNVKLPEKEKKKLKKSACKMRMIANRKTNVYKKRQLLKQHGGFLPALLTPIITIASGIIGGLLNK